MKKAALTQRAVQVPGGGFSGKELELCTCILHIDFIQRQVVRALAVLFVSTIFKKSTTEWRREETCHLSLLDEV